MHQSVAFWNKQYVGRFFANQSGERHDSTLVTHSITNKSVPKVLVYVTEQLWQQTAGVMLAMPSTL